MWPRVVGKAIAEGSQTFPTPPSEGSSKERISTSGFDMKKILYSIAWLLLLIFIAMPLAYFLSWWWLLIMPFESMIEARKFVVGEVWLFDSMRLFVNGILTIFFLADCL